jgi:hypothetical protein
MPLQFPLQHSNAILTSGEVLICPKLFLQLDYGLITLVQPCCKCDHDVPLLEEELLVAIHLGLVFLYLLPLFLDVAQSSLVLLTNGPLLLLQSRLELWCVLYLLPANEQLRVKSLNLLLKSLLLLFLLYVLPGPRLQSSDSGELVLLGPALLLLELEHGLLVDHVTASLLQLLSQFL